MILGVGSALRDAWYSYRRHRGSLLGAALAFYTLLSLAPLLVVGVAIAGFVFGEGAARAQALGAIDELVGARGAVLVGAWMDRARAASSEATLIGSLLFLYGASRVFVQLESALDAVWDAPVKEHETLAQAVRHVARERALSVLSMIAFGLVIAGSIVVQILLDVATGAIQPEAGGALVQALLRIAHLAFSLVVLTAGFALAFRRAPHRHIELRETWLGAFVTALLFSAGNSLLGFYFAHVDVGAAYGAAGSVVAVLVWLVYSGQIVLYGAELTRVVAMRGGRVAEQEPSARAAPGWPYEEEAASP